MDYLCSVNTKETSPALIDTVDPRTCFNGKLRRLSRMITGIYEKELIGFGLRSSQVSILMMIGKKESVNQKEIADFLFIDQSTMSRDLTKLIGKDLIRVTKGTDARHSMLELSKKGSKLLNEIVPVWNNMNEKIERTLGSLNASALDLITEGLKQHTEK
jgi:DNA-binding MarR family transcriptional regulator